MMHSLLHSIAIAPRYRRYYRVSGHTALSEWSHCRNQALALSLQRDSNTGPGASSRWRATSPAEPGPGPHQIASQSVLVTSKTGETGIKYIKSRHVHRIIAM